jgi:hypothetical protein
MIASKSVGERDANIGTSFPLRPVSKELFDFRTMCFNKRCYDKRKRNFESTRERVKATDNLQSHYQQDPQRPLCWKGHCPSRDYSKASSNEKIHNAKQDSMGSVSDRPPCFKGHCPSGDSSEGSNEKIHNAKQDSMGSVSDRPLPDETDVSKKNSQNLIYQESNVLQDILALKKGADEQDKSQEEKP